MGLLDSFKKALGLAPDIDNEYDDAYGEDATVTPLKAVREAVAENTAQEVIEEVVEQPVEAKIEVPVDRIFTTVIEMFNRTLPSFLANSVNPEEQRRQLYDALDTDVRSYLDTVAAKSMDACNRQWEQSRISLNTQINKLKTQLHTVEEAFEEKSKAVLSADRQRRAINERIRDYENQINKLEAEKEQYDLENRSLLNKLRLADVTGGASHGDSTVDAALQQELDELKKQVSDLTGRNEELSNLNKELNARAMELEQTNSDLKASVTAMEMKSQMSDTMFTDLNERAASASHEVTQRDELILSLRTQLEEAKAAAAAGNDTEELARLKAEAEAEVARLKAELDEANSNLDIAAEVFEQVERLKEIQEKKNNVINELTREIKKRDDRINALETEERSLRGTIEANIKDHALNIQELNQRIQNLKNNQAAEKTSKRRGKTQRITAIDDDIDNTDWLVSTPPEGMSIKTSGVSDDEFGYQEPQRKTPPENASQMSLW